MTTTDDIRKRQIDAANAAVRDHLADMMKRAEGFEKLTQDARFREGDARNAFLHNACSLINVYCVSLGFELTALRQRLSGSPLGQTSIDRVLGATFTAEGIRTPLLNYYRAKQRGHLFLDVWCAFEDALRAVERAAVPPAARANDELGAHIGVPTIWTRVSDVVKQQTKDAGAIVPPREERRRHSETVVFCSDARNTIHSNTFYEGKERKELTFKNGVQIELVPAKNTDFLSTAIVPLLIDQLVDAWLYVRNGIREPAHIPTPASLLKSPYEWGRDE